MLARETKKVQKSKAKVHQASRNKGHLAATSTGPVITCESGLPQLPALTATTQIHDTTGI